LALFRVLTVAHTAGGFFGGEDVSSSRRGRIHDARPRVAESWNVEG
jgi:hypothetical protein